MGAQESDWKYNLLSLCEILLQRVILRISFVFCVLIFTWQFMDMLKHICLAFL